MNYRKLIQRPVHVITGLSVLLASFIPIINAGGVANAAGLVSSRSIQMSTSAISQTGTTYTVTFTPVAGTAQSLVIDFCMNDPIINDTCTTASDVSTSSATFTPVTNMTGWTLGTAGATTVKINKGTGSQLSAGLPASFTLSNVTNPLTLGTFYARIYTYSDNSYGSTTTPYTSPTAVGNDVDQGGFALSTASQIVITAKVQEQLTFCVYTGANCAAGGTTVTLGNTQGVLSSSGPFVDKNTRYDVQTNATGGAVVNVKGTTLTSGSSTIPAMTTAAVSTAGTSQFGLCTYESAGTNLSYTTNTYNGAGGSTPGTICSTTTQTAGTGSTGGTGTPTAAQFYYGTNALTGTYGDTIANAAAGASSTGTVAFLGNVSTSQVAGVYTSTLTFIATGTY